jgi:hypothetical protein
MVQQINSPIQDRHGIGIMASDIKVLTNGKMNMDFSEIWSVFGKYFSNDVI